MTRTTTRNNLVALLAAMLLSAGCSKEYEHERFAQDSPEAGHIRKLVGALREGGPDRLDELVSGQAAPGLTEKETRSLRFVLAQIVEADSVELEKTERFGKQVYRAVLRLTGKDGPRTLAVLLVKTEDGTLRWVGKN